MVRVTIIKLLHYGKCNDVFLSEDEEGGLYALKRYYLQELESCKEYVNLSGKLKVKNWLDEFKRGLEIQMAVDHEACIKCVALHGLDLAKDDTNVAAEIELVLEYAEFGCLMELSHFDTYIPLFPREVIKAIAKDIFSALNYLASMNIAHRDVKPSNIFMNKQGRSKLGDFQESEYFDSRGMVKGTKGAFYFYSPEMASLNTDEFNASACDVWSFGVTLWLLYFRRFPFKNPSSAMLNLFLEISNFDVEHALKQLRLEITDIEDDFEDLIKQVLHVDPKARITPEQAMNHKWLNNIDYSFAKQFVMENLPQEYL
ncbi:bifunctional Protein kinase domain/Protein kinase-like domain superfamily/Serine-threonine-protein kinase [Babesia duncani]|uniref:Bifunctional Protein kinase domain/Protein kinase-like domain superfamily/Serine-threonine-protein kinase n=1 Tax=Babesia duncani TaxID=323732 RepID=A0AAD9PJ84_9APIC|nr:bifunctional Protein kinase domain/Protein kinase-like domain superfamily/Serine-threonine-protein kinase [Babesia duncani]